MLVVVCVVSALWWVWSLYAIVCARRSLPILSEEQSPVPEQWPRVSLIITARDEARDLERCVRTRLEGDYPNLEVIIVDDRSTDGTSEIAEHLASKDTRVKVVHINELPSGWLGKLYALYSGVKIASGEWLLFSDADIEFAPHTLRHAVAYCEHEGRDHMSVVPSFREHGLVIDAAINVFSQALLVGGRPWKAKDPHSKVALGAGLFNLVRRSSYDQTPGFEWLRLEIADDIALGQMLKRRGARPIVMNAVGAVTLDFYRDIRELACGMEKSGFAVLARCSAVRLILLCVVGLIFQIGFLIGLFCPVLWLQRLSLIITATACLSQSLMARFMGRKILPALLFPLGVILMGWMLLRSGLLVWWRGGVAWRGTLYRVSELRAGSRVEFK
jgi:cellulose synthase/poly-beta-1,6-N-acetylglucosamine synthase-like glycosyltransferase